MNLKWKADMAGSLGGMEGRNIHGLVELVKEAYQF